MKYTILLVIFLQGCSTLISKGINLRPEIDQTGHVYSGMTHWASFGCGMPILLDGLKSDNGGDVVSSVFMIPFLTAIMVVDFPLSLVADTLFVPVDLVSEPTQERKTVEYYCDKEEGHRRARTAHNK